jgi:hypothetical protein
VRGGTGAGEAQGGWHAVSYASSASRRAAAARQAEASVRSLRGSCPRRSLPAGLVSPKAAGLLPTTECRGTVIGRAAERAIHRAQDRAGRMGSRLPNDSLLGCFMTPPQLLAPRHGLLRRWISLASGMFASTARVTHQGTRHGLQAARPVSCSASFRWRVGWPFGATLLDRHRRGSGIEVTAQGALAARAVAVVFCCR